MECSELRATLNYRQVLVPRYPDKGGLSLSAEPLVLLSCNKDCPYMQLVSGVMHIITVVPSLSKHCLHVHLTEKNVIINIGHV